MTAHYRAPINFTWEALEASENAYKKLVSAVQSLKDTVASSERTQLSNEKLAKIDGFRSAFVEAISSDLNMPQALAVVWEVVKTNIPDYDKYELLLSYDEVLGLNLKEGELLKEVMPKEITELLAKREALRADKKYEEADQIRKIIEEKGYTVKDAQITRSN